MKELIDDIYSIEDNKFVSTVIIGIFYILVILLSISIFIFKISGYIGLKINEFLIRRRLK